MNQGGNTQDCEKVTVIRNTIRAKGDELRRRYPILKQNNAIGMAIFLSATTATLLCGWAYWQSLIPAWLCVVLVALSTSLLHELEHDLIHLLYFKNNKPIHNLMLFGVWLFRPGTLSPWARREMHFLHHKVSGTPKDIEERGIGNGSPYGWLRLWIMLDTFVGNLIRITLQFPRGTKLKAIKTLSKNYFPLGIITALFWYNFLIFHAINYLCAMISLPLVWPTAINTAMDVINFVTITLIAPFYLRSFCLNFISSNMHYYGGVDSLIKQTQVLNTPLLWPLQLFCFNFGSTHGIHHFVVGEPFYIRQMTTKSAHKVMKENGVRFNDLGTFKRENRFDLQHND
ncbi:MAG: fatty acid desaturase [Pseudomonadales bacterium]|nr:fatty acid desaturase [Pseudomonadales bacterium]